MKPEPVFKSEAELCAAFISGIPDGWIAYAETAGWDILLVRSDGVQVGIEAKLKLNATVLLQAAEGRWGHDQGPDYRAALVPWVSNTELAALAPHCGITIIKVDRDRLTKRQTIRFWPDLPKLDGKSDSYFDGDDWHEMMPEKRHPLPEFVPDVVAGAPSPLQLTDWKIKALKLTVLLEKTGILVRGDFKHHQADIRRWIAGKWIVPGNGGFVAGPYFPNFRAQHPTVCQQIEADETKWKRAFPIVVPAA